jgi:AraC-like DNA-binding protein
MDALPGLYDGKRWYSHQTDHPYRFRYLAAGDGAVTLRRSQMSGFIRGEIPPGDDYVVQWIDAGSSIVDLGRDDVPQQLHQPLLFPPDREFVFTFTDYDQRLVHLNRDLVRDIAAERYAINRDQLRFQYRQTPSAEAVLRWRQSVATASRALGDVGTGSVLWHEATREVAAAFLGMYRPQGDELSATLRHPGHARVRRAVDHIHNHAHEPLTVADIAGAADLSIRGLQDAFQRVLGLTPMMYLRQVRLAYVHEDLLQGDPDATSVGDVAKRWGFTHAGRFSGAYAQRYGEYPKTTLRR